VNRYNLTSITRIAHFDERAFTVGEVARDEWRNGDYVVGEIVDARRLPHEIEVPSGRLAEVISGDLVVGALGVRAATLGIVGDWREIGDDGAMEMLSIAGCIGRTTSASTFARQPIPLRYRGHVHVGGVPARMRDHVAVSGFTGPFAVPTVLIIGTSMDAGKTLSAKRVVRELKARGLKVAAAKLTGIARYRDVLSMGDAGADAIFDFVDAGLSSTVVEPAEFVERMEVLLGMINATEPDVLVAEAGASPLEPYNGDAAVRLLGDATRCIILCASDPYAVAGVMSGFDTVPDLVAGRATSTSAGIALVEKLTGVKALNLLDPQSDAMLARLLVESLGLERR